MNLLEVKDVTKRYRDHLALDSVSLAVGEGSIYGLLGPNGAGKTTLIRIINRIAAADSGEVLLGGHQLTADDIRHLGYLPEERGLYKKLRVGEQALYLAQLHGMSRADATRELRRWFARWELDGWWSKKVDELSKGMAQKVQFITTVLHRPSLVILDEPFSGFDPVNAQVVRDAILELNQQGTTFIISTHNMTSVEELCGSLSLIDHARIVLQGNVDEIRRSHAGNRYRLTTDRQITLTDINAVLQSQQDGRWVYEVDRPADMTTNQLLAAAMSSCTVLGLEEIIPSMNDIFISTVKGGGDNGLGV